MSNTAQHSEDHQARIEQMFLQNDHKAAQDIIFRLMIKVKLACIDKPQAYLDFKAAIKQAVSQ